MYCPECGRYGRTDDSYSGRLCPECEEMLQDMEDTMREIQGSGAEDIGGRVKYDRNHEYDLQQAELANTQEQRNIIAEHAARDRRLMRDAIVNAALTRLEATGREQSAVEWSVWVSAYVGQGMNADDVASLIAEIRVELSPLVRS